MERKNAIVNLKDNAYELTEFGKEGLALYKKPETKIKTSKMAEYEYIDVNKLHKDIKEILKKHTGSDQAKAFGNTYFVPSVIDLEEHLLKFKRKYKKLWDVNKIIQSILLYTEKCAREKAFTPIIKYYIYKEDKGSFLAASLESEDTFKDETQDFNVVDTKNLFE
jgi:hypothetical protein